MCDFCLWGLTISKAKPDMFFHESSSKHPLLGSKDKSLRTPQIVTLFPEEMGLSLSPHLPPLHHLWLNVWRFFRRERWLRSAITWRQTTRVPLSKAPLCERQKLMCQFRWALLGISPNLNNNRKIAEHIPHKATLFNTAKSACQIYWVVLCEARTLPPRGAIISESGQEVLSHLLCASHSDGTPLALPPRSFPNSSAQRSCIASPSWWTGIQ